MWGNSPWLSPLEMLKMNSLGPLRASIALIPLGTKGSFGMSWLFTQLVELALVHWGDVNVSRFLSERLGEARLCPAMMEFFDFIFY